MGKYKMEGIEFVRQFQEGDPWASKTSQQLGKHLLYEGGDPHLHLKHVWRRPSNQGLTNQRELPAMCCTQAWVEQMTQRWSPSYVVDIKIECARDADPESRKSATKERLQDWHTAIARRSETTIP